MKIKQLTDIPSVASYLRRIGAEARALTTAVVKEHRGNYWVDLARIKVTKDGIVEADQEYAPTEAEAAVIKVEVQSVKWPEQAKLQRLSDLPDELSKADSSDLFVFRDEDKNIIMVQQRVERKTGKAYIPWTYWDDGEWRKMEPEGKLPLWGIDQLNEHSVAFVHEGAKAARAMTQMVEANTKQDKARLHAHPWGEELQHAAHLGWIGGALSPARTDWSALMRLGVKKVYIVSDNDMPGISAVPTIAYRLRIPTFHVQFTNEWPISFDLADEFPKAMFSKVDGIHHYIGPSFRSCVHPATWATDQVPNPRGKPSNVLRPDFKSLWAYIEESDLFVCLEIPEILRTESVLNKMLAPFSHTMNTSQLISRNYRGRQTRLAYRPDIKGRIISDTDTSAINLHTPTHIKSIMGNADPWVEFITYLFPNESERVDVFRWCATLIARLEVRMEYGMLLVSERQGVGKTTLGEKILAPLVGQHNTGYPSEDAVANSAFNGWLANKRLIVIGEIYSGHSWKAYNRLKSYITDKMVDVNEKFMRPYKVENWCHIFACSNSRRALKMDQDDRRWFYPEVTEVAWPREKFEEFNNWVQSGGLSIIKHWAENYGDYVTVGERAPMTEMKKELIEGSRSEAQKAISDFCEAVIEEKIIAVFGMKSIAAWVRDQVQGHVYDTDYELRKVAKEKGMLVFKKRVKIGLSIQYAIMTPEFYRANKDELCPEILREHFRHPHDLIQSSL